MSGQECVQRAVWMAVTTDMSIGEQHVLKPRNLRVDAIRVVKPEAGDAAGHELLGHRVGS